MDKKDPIIISDDEDCVIISKPRKRVIEDDGKLLIRLSKPKLEPVTEITHTRKNASEIPQHTQANPPLGSHIVKHELIVQQISNDPDQASILPKSVTQQSSIYAQRVSITGPLIAHDSVQRINSTVTDVFANFMQAEQERVYRGVPDIPIFARDILNCKVEGPKTYIPSGYSRIFDKIKYCYSIYGSTERVYLPAYYEVIEENRLCNIFMDLEYEYDDNPGKDPVSILGEFVRDFHAYMIETGIISSNRKLKTLVLHCQSATKASFHLHFTGENWIFKNIYHVGAYVRNFVIWTLEKYGKDVGKHPYFFKEAGKQSKKFFADMAVYTRNRAFRLAYCAKSCGDYGRKPLLTPKEWGHVDPEYSNYCNIVPDPNVFMQSIPCYTSPAMRYDVITCLNPDGSEPTSSSYQAFWSSPGYSMGRGGKTFERTQDNGEAITEVCKEIALELAGEPTRVYLIGHDPDKHIAIIGTHCKRCPIKMLYEGVQYHKSNHIYFVMHYTEYYAICRCKDESCLRRNGMKMSIDRKWMMKISDALPARLAKVDYGPYLSGVNSIMGSLRSKIKELRQKKDDLEKEREKLQIKEINQQQIANPEKECTYETVNE